MNQPSPCPTERQLVDFVREQLPQNEQQFCQAHIENCRRCCDAVGWIRQHQQRDDPESRIDESVQSDSDSELQQEVECNPSAIIPTRISREWHSSDSDESGDAKLVERIGKYEILSLIGKGAFGTVYKAYDEQLRRMVALKLLKRSVAENVTARRRFIREARAAAAISHPNVVTIYAVDEVDGLPLLVMELVSGRTLRERIKVEPKLEMIEIVRIGAQIASGLSAAHSQGVVHRDVKPSNVLLENGVERVKLSDFGLATCTVDNVELTSCNLAVGTPAYMSPEQARGETVDARSDLFGLGCVLYAMVAGDSPFLAKTSFETGHRVVEWEPPRLDQGRREVPDFLADLVDQLLRKDPQDRPASADEVAQRLNEHLIEMNRGSLLCRLKRADLSQPNRRWSWVGVVIVVLLATTWAISSWLPGRSTTSAVLADKGARGNVLSEESNVSTATIANSESISLSPIDMDVLIWEADDPNRQGRSIRERNILPLSETDSVRVEIRFGSSLFAHLIWIDGAGAASPVFPWEPGNWDGPIRTRSPVAAISLPEKIDTAWPNSGNAGMETLILLADTQPPDESVNFRELLKGFPVVPAIEMRKFFEFDETGSARWELDRGPNFSSPQVLDDHVQQTKQFIQERLAPRFAVVRVLRFVNQGTSQSTPEHQISGE